MNKPLLEVTDLCIGYDGKSIVDDICFSVEIGAYLCIVGENGTGKSTLLKTISGLLKPIYGTVHFAVPRCEIGYLPQQMAVRHDFPASAKEIISSGALSRGKWYRPFYSKDEKERIAWACEKTGVVDFIGQSFSELSGGQQQRVLLARALVTAKNAVILDEPTAGLDPEAVKEFYGVLTKLNDDEKITIIMVTHDIEGAEKHASHIVELGGERSDEGEDFFFGTVGNYIERGRHNECG
ncbi:MAG: ABC transporter ATP-binding protein [Defluviitaleaceae bacterium]|nr:ABC transporter ATP-binding protein [Defluviitaleaceae bacterium]